MYDTLYTHKRESLAAEFDRIRAPFAVGLDCSLAFR
jgi:hypothetical protein